ncbi:TatD family hydrolase [Catenovulum sp. 2E275]|uniref:TatD family hydrolase n=1 Tax=Catenovulum sp. 2E275 TaxID=2980497 RepID=UPI0021CFC8AD|nr:TatD family hydrolase [Catenovulum sp. 2E275]MCU4676890.1 TatD family hydrolase [Catenovulum sp. 2E275]
MIFFDSHCHLDLLAKKLDLNQVVINCKNNQINRILMPGISKNNWSEIKQIANGYSDQTLKLDYAFGLHPYFIAEHDIQTDLTELETQLKRDKFVVAVGEIGLDNFVAKQMDNHKQQEILLIEQLKLAQAYHLPVIIHHRQSIDKICQLIREQKFEYGGVVHAFSGSQQQAKNLIELGFKLGIGGIITYPRANKTRQVVKTFGCEHFLLETDAPDMPLNGRQGQVNSPEYLIEIFNQLVALKSMPAEQLSRVLWQNTLDCFPKLKGITA